MQFCQGGVDGDEAEGPFVADGGPGEDAVDIDDVRLKHGDTYDREKATQTIDRTMSGLDIGHRIPLRRWRIIALPFTP